ncbi:MAG: DUF6089 family protein [Bacteroidales bacterium]|nr:DUF6089 family protein [Bacteroidales bacterium]
MNRLTLLIIFYFFLTCVHAQDDLSIGFYGGTSQYMGDMNKANPFFSPLPAFGFGIKSDQGLRYSFHLMGSYNPLRGSTKYVEQYNLPDSDIGSFNTRQIDLSLMAEFNFLPYETYNIRKRNFAPFVFGGVGATHFLSDVPDKFQVTIPFGLGIKYNIFERFSIGILWMAKKIFYDNRDKVVNVSEKDKGAIIHNDDWYHHGFLFLTFKPFKEQTECPTYEE